MKLRDRHNTVSLLIKPLKETFHVQASDLSGSMNLYNQGTNLIFLLVREIEARTQAFVDTCATTPNLPNS